MPDYETEGDCGSVTWRIKKGLLVAPAGRTKGYLKLTVQRPPADGQEHPGTDLITGTVTSEVANFYPLIAGWGWFSRIGQHIYRITQLRIHVIVTHAFLRSLARLDLAPSVVGALKAQASEEVERRSRRRARRSGRAGSDERGRGVAAKDAGSEACFAGESTEDAGRRARAAQLIRPAVMSRSFWRSCRALTRRTVPERERMTSDSVVAPRRAPEPS